MSGDPAPHVDALGDPLPERALRRFGSARFRHGNQIMALARSADGQIVATGGFGTICLWSAASGRLLKVLRTEGHVFALGFSASPDGQALATARVKGLGEHGAIRLWDLATTRQRWSVRVGSGQASLGHVFRAGVLAGRAAARLR